MTSGFCCSPLRSVGLSQKCHRRAPWRSSHGSQQQPFSPLINGNSLGRWPQQSSPPIESPNRLTNCPSVNHQLCWCEPIRLRRSKVSGMALATGECGLRFHAQHRRLAPCRSVFWPLLGAFRHRQRRTPFSQAQC